MNQSQYKNTPIKRPHSRKQRCISNQIEGKINHSMQLQNQTSQDELYCTPRFTNQEDSHLQMSPKKQGQHNTITYHENEDLLKRCLLPQINQNRSKSSNSKISQSIDHQSQITFSSPIRYEPLTPNEIKSSQKLKESPSKKDYKQKKSGIKLMPLWDQCNKQQEYKFFNIDSIKDIQQLREKRLDLIYNRNNRYPKCINVNQFKI